MPEIVEIRKYADFIKNKIKNTKLKDIKILKGRYKTHGPFDKYSELIKQLPLKIIDVKTKGKFLYIMLENDYYIFSTLGLHGGWLYNESKNKITPKYINENKMKFKFNTMLEYVNEENIDAYHKVALNNLNVQFITDNGSMIYFDSLSFGTLKVINDINELTFKLNSIGPDIMDKLTTYDVFIERLLLDKNLNKKIGIVLMDQKIISGIGNYLRADILWLSKISPFRKVKDLSNLEIKKIYNNVKMLTWSDYNKLKGIKLNYIKSDSKTPLDYNLDFFAYNNDYDIYENKIVKELLYEGSQKRFIYWSPKIQH